MISRLFLAAVCLATSMFAAPPLTTIQDVLYKADGTRFHGTVTISWSSFEAIDRSAIQQQTTTVTVVNGNLQIQLVPTTTASPAAFYTVVYNSDGLVQFQETWAVPSSVQPLRVRDVRVATAGGVGADTVTTTVQESDIIGLLSDLGARPLKGPAYAAGRVAFVNSTGAMETVVGSPTDCVRVDGSSGPCGGVQPNFVDADAPAGLVDGANTAFTLSGVPSPTASLTVYRNGMLQKAGQDFALAGNQINFVAAASSFRLRRPNPGTPCWPVTAWPGAPTARRSSSPIRRCCAADSARLPLRARSPAWEPASSRPRPWRRETVWRSASTWNMPAPWAASVSSCTGAPPPCWRATRRPPTCWPRAGQTQP